MKWKLELTLILQIIISKNNFNKETVYPLNTTIVQ